jgi:hypothetical protein
MRWTTLRRPRALSPSDAAALIGDPVDPLPANIHDPTIVVDPDLDEPVLAYLPVPDTAALRRAVRGIEFSPTGGQVRANGIRNASRTFGYAPRRPVYRQDGCRVTALEVDYPSAHHAVLAYATRLRAVLEEVAPGVVDAGRKTMTEVDADWKVGESDLWTSGVINSSSRLPYHTDAMNFPVWSAMPVLRRAMDGGYLSVPEYDLVLPCRDGWGVFFPGYQLVHGVTPMSPTRPDGYRYSLVYYALRGMQDCFTYAVEREHARTRRTEREREIARGLAEGRPVSHDMGAYTPARADYQREMTAEDRAAHNTVRRATAPRRRREEAP